MKNKILVSIGLTLFLLIAQFGVVMAAQEVTPITGTVVSVTTETDATTNETTVVVVILDEMGVEQTLRLSAQDAEDLGLVDVDDTTGAVTVLDVEGTTVEIDPALVLEDGEGEEEEDQHPVASALADFFGEMFGVDYDVIMDAHEEGVGFGVIAQALWMTERLEGDSETFQEILDAKLNKDFEFTLADGTTVEAQNWGQFKKAIMGTGGRENLGTVMSGKDAEKDNPGQQNRQNRGNGNGGGNGNGNGGGNGGGNNNRP